MSSNWTRYRLEELGDIVTGKTPPSKVQDAFSYSGTQFVTPRDMDGRRWIDSTERFLSESGVAAVKNSLVPSGSVAVSCIGSDMGKAVLLKVESVTNQQINTLVVDTQKFNAKFVYYVLSTKQDEFKSIAGGSATPILNKGHFGKFEIDLPTKDEQDFLVRCLDSLDSKIENNTQTNQTLEQIAQAIFKSWFVDFDPVKAKIDALAADGSAADAELAAMGVISAKTLDELNSLKTSNPEAFNKLAQTAALFPAAMQDSELGEIPEGWSYCTFGDISACFDSKRVPLSKRKREEKQPGTIPYYGATSVMDYVNEWIFDDTYLLLGEDGSVVKDDGTPFVQYIWGKSWVNNHAHVLQGNNGVSTEHLMVFIKGTNIASYVTGAVQLKLNQKNMNSIPFLKASTEINLVFQGVLNGLYDAYKNNIESSQSLSSLRDSLLPRLLSGEMKLKDKE